MPPRSSTSRCSSGPRPPRWRRSWRASARPTTDLQALLQRRTARPVRHGVPHRGASSPARARRKMPRPGRLSARRSPRWRRTPASSGGGAQGCDMLADLETKLPSDANLSSLATGAVVGTRSTTTGRTCCRRSPRGRPTPYGKAKASWSNAVQETGSTATQHGARGRRAARPQSASNPQYGVWVPVARRVLTPFSPEPTDVLNATANVGRAAPAAVSGPRRRPFPPAAERGAPPPRHGGGPRAGRARTWWSDKPPPCWRRPGAGPSCARRAIRPPSRFPGVPLVRPPLRDSGDLRRGLCRASWRHWSWPPSRRRPSLWSTPCPDRRWWPSAPSSCCAPTVGWTVTTLPALSFLDLAWAAPGHRPAGAGGAAGRRQRLRAGPGRAGRPVPGGPVLVPSPPLRGQARGG